METNPATNNGFSSNVKENKLALENAILRRKVKELQNESDSFRARYEELSDRMHADAQAAMFRKINEQSSRRAKEQAMQECKAKKIRLLNNKTVFQVAQLVLILAYSFFAIGSDKNLLLVVIATVLAWNAGGLYREMQVIKHGIKTKM